MADLPVDSSSSAPLADKTDAELLYLAQHTHRLPVGLGEAAIQELQRRELVPAQLPADRSGHSPAPNTAPRGTLAVLGQVLRGIFQPRAGYFVTPLLLLVNLAVFGLMLPGAATEEPSPARLVAWGSNFGPLLVAQPWRLVSSLFLHSGPAHLLLNMGALLLLGLVAERVAGPVRWLLTYVLSGVGGGLLSAWWHHQHQNSVGASGAIFGLYGLLIALLLTRALPLTPQNRASFMGLLLYFAVGSLAGGFTTLHTDNAAHLGGLLTGIVVGAGLLLFFRPPAAPRS